MPLETSMAKKETVKNSKCVCENVEKVEYSHATKQG